MHAPYTRSTIVRVSTIALVGVWFAGIVARTAPAQALGVASVNTWPDSRTPGGAQQTASDRVTLTVLYDNTTAREPLRADWGFAVLIETPDDTLLFDAGADGAMLLENMRLLGKNPRAIRSVVISHAHGDHVGGLQALLDRGSRPRVYVPRGIGASVWEGVSGAAEISVTTEGQEIVPGVRATGRVGTGIAEQALIVATADGPLLLTGCSHPGLVAMIDQAARIVGTRITGVMGGFHLMAASAEQLEQLAASLRAWGIERIGPGHCSGPRAMELFHAAYGEKFVELGAGRAVVHQIPPAR